MRADIVRLYECVLTSEAWNDPRTQMGGVGVSRKPESRAPGRQQCKSLLATMRQDLHRFADRRQHAQEHADVYEPKSSTPDSIGGIETDLPSCDPVVIRPHKRHVSEAWTRTHLNQKYAVVVDALDRND